VRALPSKPEALFKPHFKKKEERISTSISSAPGTCLQKFLQLSNDYKNGMQFFTFCLYNSLVQWLPSWAVHTPHKGIQSNLAGKEEILKFILIFNFISFLKFIFLLTL
jgi:hypothetical protein